jgi:transcription elongation factor/antiterminator RfaH
MPKTFYDETNLQLDYKTAWYCIYTKPKQEDLLSMKLRDLTDIEIFSPKLRTKRIIRGKVNDVTEEFFPCYIFAKFDPKKYFHMIKYTRGVRRVVGNSLGLPYVVDERIIELIKSRMKNGFISIEQSRLVEGEEVTITEGPFKGIKGLFSEDLKPRDRVLILLNTIKYQAKVTIEADFVKKA